MTMSRKAKDESYFKAYLTSQLAGEILKSQAYRKLCIPLLPHVPLKVWSLLLFAHMELELLDKGDVQSHQGPKGPEGYEDMPVIAD